MLSDPKKLRIGQVKWHKHIVGDICSIIDIFHIIWREYVFIKFEFCLQLFSENLFAKIAYLKNKFVLLKIIVYKKRYQKFKQKSFIKF